MQPNSDHSAFLVARARELSEDLLKHNSIKALLIKDLAIVTTIVLADVGEDVQTLVTLSTLFSTILQERVESLQNFAANLVTQS